MPRPVLIFLLAVAIAFAPADASGQRRRLASRALFAALDSTAIEDSSTMQPMDRRERLDSIMLDMAVFLDRYAGRSYSLSDTRVRKWGDYGTQAHPELGILVDTAQLAELLRAVTGYKGRVGVPPAEIERRLEYVVRFVIAHEYAHLIQYRYWGLDSVANLNATRVVECGADLLGGLNLHAFLASRSRGGPLPEAATQTAIDFGYVVGSPDWLDGTTHPLPEDRRRCIARGVEVATALAQRDASRGGRADPAALEAGRWLAKEEPELHSGKLNLMAWSQLRARAIASEMGVAEGSAVLTVVRDSSAEQLVRKLAQATAKGREALRAFRGPSAPTGESMYLLREALPPPWQCIIGEERKTETALCRQTVRDDNLAENDFQRLVVAVERAVAGKGWKRVDPDRVPADSTQRQKVTLGQAVFIPQGAAAGAVKSARIRVSWDEYRASMTAQVPPQQVISVRFRTQG